MSGVLKRNRKVSEFKFFSVAIAIRTETNKLMANSKVVPKSYRLLNAVPTVETARSLVYNICDPMRSIRPTASTRLSAAAT